MVVYMRRIFHFKKLREKLDYGNKSVTFVYSMNNLLTALLFNALNRCGKMRHYLTFTKNELQGDYRFIKKGWMDIQKT